MTKKEKEHKAKLIILILLLNFVSVKRKSPVSVFSYIQFANRQLFWITELKKLMAQPTFEPGGIEHKGRGKTYRVPTIKFNLK